MAVKVMMACVPPWFSVAPLDPKVDSVPIHMPLFNFSYLVLKVRQTNETETIWRVVVSLQTQKKLLIVTLVDLD